MALSGLRRTATNVVTSKTWTHKLSQKFLASADLSVSLPDKKRWCLNLASACWQISIRNDEENQNAFASELEVSQWKEQTTVFITLQQPWSEHVVLLWKKIVLHWQCYHSLNICWGSHCRHVSIQKNFGSVHDTWINIKPAKCEVLNIASIIHIG